MPYSLIGHNSLPTDSNELQSMVLELLSREQSWRQSNSNLEQSNIKLTAENATLKNVVEQLKAQLTLLKNSQFGSKSEKGRQLIEQVEELLEEEEIALGLSTSKSNNILDNDANNSNKARRLKLPPSLPREEKLLPSPSECPSCNGNKFRQLGEDISEVLEYIPASYKVLKYIRPRCVCLDCQEIVQADVADKVIDKGKAGPGLLSQIIVRKYSYHLPLYRQSKMFESEEIDISRSTMGGWVGRCASLLEPLIDKIKGHVLATAQIHSDDTPIKVLEPGLKKTKQARLWSYVSDGRPHGSDYPPAACYFYSPNRKGEHPLAHLKGYEGVVHADAYSGYDKLYKDEEGKETKIKECGCWAHTRRKFYEATLLGKAKIASEVINHLTKIYKIEDDVRGLDPGTRLKARMKLSKPLIDELFKRLKEVKDKVPAKGKTATAIIYALNQEAALRRFLSDGHLEIDNNAAERSLRGIAVGRKNWLFAGSNQGGKTAANMFTLIETAKLNDMDPWLYLQKVLTVIQGYNSQKLDDLLPWNILQLKINPE